MGIPVGTLEMELIPVPSVPYPTFFQMPKMAGNSQDNPLETLGMKLIPNISASLPKTSKFPI